MEFFYAQGNRLRLPAIMPNNLMPLICCVSGIAVGAIWWFQVYYNLLIPFNFVSLPSLALSLLLGGYFLIKQPDKSAVVRKTLYCLFVFQMQVSWWLASTLTSINYCTYYLCCLAIFIPLLYVASHFCFDKYASTISVVNAIGFLVSSIWISLFQTDSKIYLILLTSTLSHPIYILIVHYVLDLEKKNTRLAIRQKELEQIANTDSLTTVANRQAIDDYILKDKIRLASNTHRNIGVILIDIDNFKRVNDTLGHPAGDAVLRKVAQVIKASVRSDDFVARYGGEEFICIINSDNFDTIHAISLRIKQDVQTINPGGVLPNVSVSIGFVVRQNGEDLTELISNADQNLYSAKNTGKNKIVFN